MRIERKQLPIAGHEVGSQPFFRSGYGHVVVRVGENDSSGGFSLDYDRQSAQAGNESVEPLGGEPEARVDFRIVESLAKLHEDGRRRNELKRALLDEPVDDLPGRALGPKQRTDDDVGVQNRANHRALLCPLASSPAPGFVREPVGILLRDASGSRPNGLEETLPGHSFEFFELLDRHHRCQRFAFPHDNELVVSQSDAVEVVAELLPDLHGRDAPGHG